MAIGWRWLAGCLMGTAVAAMALSAAPVVAAETLYRYRNADNVTVIGFSIPPEFALKGYDIITPKGKLIETVPPVSDLASQDQKNQLREQQRLDKFILRSYSTVQDVNNARNRSLTLLSRELDILKTNIDEYRNRRSQLRKQAGSYQASGTAPPEAIEAVLADLRDQERNTRKMLADRQQQHEALAEKYDYYARRLVELKGEIALGPRLDAREDDSSDEKSPSSAPAPATLPLAND